MLWIYPDRITDATNLGAPALAQEISVGAGFVIEMVLTFLLVWVHLRDRGRPAWLLRLDSGPRHRPDDRARRSHGRPLTGAALNPSRAFGPELVASFWDDAWLWYLAPLLSGGLAALAYDHPYLRGLEVPPAGTVESDIAEPAVGEDAT